MLLKASISATTPPCRSSARDRKSTIEPNCDASLLAFKSSAAIVPADAPLSGPCPGPPPFFFFPTTRIANCAAVRPEARLCRTFSWSRPHAPAGTLLSAVLSEAYRLERPGFSILIAKSWSPSCPRDIEDKILPASLSFVQQSSRFSGGCEGLGEFFRRSDLARLLMRPVERHSVHRPLLILAWAAITRPGSRRQSPLRLPRRFDEPRSDWRTPLWPIRPSPPIGLTKSSGGQPLLSRDSCRGSHLKIGLSWRRWTG